jgi:hypothetical protein
MTVKNSNDTVGNRTRYLLACSAVPHPTAPPRAPTPPYKVSLILWTRTPKSSQLAERLGQNWRASNYNKGT